MTNIKYDFYDETKQIADKLTENWVLPILESNPGMLKMLEDHEKKPYRQLLPWSGEFVGKHLTSAVGLFALTGAKELEKHIRFLVGRLNEIQETDGYIGPWAKEYQLTGESPNSRYDFMENDDGTQDTVKNWDTWDLYHLMYALICWYRCTQDQTALKIAVRMADLICSHFYERDVPVISVGTPETNLALEGKAYYEMPVPRWEGLHSVMAFPVLYDLTGEEKYREAFEKIWRSIRDFDRHNTGGFSSGEAACGNPYDERPIETCCTVAWMALTVERYRLEPKSTETADELELSYYNGGLGAISPSGRWCTYNTPMDGYRISSLKDISFQSRPGTPELNCCSVNAPRIVGLLPRWCCRQEGRNLYVEYYGEYTAEIETEDTKIIVTQRGDYLGEGKIFLTLTAWKETELILNLRIPGWCDAAEVRTEKAVLKGRRGEYVTIEGTWSGSVEVEIRFEKHIFAVRGEKEKSGKASLYYGPILLAYDMAFNESAPDEVEIDTNYLEPLRIDYRPDRIPHLFIDLADAKGRKITLCDFRSAGYYGDYYMSWIRCKQAMCPDKKVEI